MKYNFGNPIFPARSTPEDLEMERGITKVIQYGDRIIAIYQNNRGDEYFDATYVFIGAGRTCEDEVILDSIGGSPSPDEGHAIEGAIWAINH